MISTNLGDQLTCPVSSQQANGDPRNGLEEIVGARHHVETIAIGNGASSGSRRTKIAKGDVSHEVGDFTESIEPNAEVEMEWVFNFLGLRITGRVDGVGNQNSAEDMIMETVFEQI